MIVIESKIKLLTVKYFHFIKSISCLFISKMKRSLFKDQTISGMQNKIVIQWIWCHWLWLFKCQHRQKQCNPIAPITSYADKYHEVATNLVERRHDRNHCDQLIIISPHCCKWAHTLITYCFAFMHFINRILWADHLKVCCIILVTKRCNMSYNKIAFFDCHDWTLISSYIVVCQNERRKHGQQK